MPTTVPALLLTQNGEIKSGKITIQAEAQGCQLSDIQKYLKKKSAPALLGTYPWKGQTLHLIGYKDGKAGTENQHELPPPHDKDLYFGDIIVLLSKDKKSFAKPLAMKSEEYENFYTQMFEGFESLGESDSEDEEEYDDEEGDEEAAEEEAEFEENEDQETFSDDNDDQETLEEFDGHTKKEKEKEKEEEEDFQPIIVKKKPRASVAKAKGKNHKDLASANIVAAVELKHEETFQETGPQQAQRKTVYNAIVRLLDGLLTNTQAAELEHHIYNTSLQLAVKRHVSKTWSQPLFVELYSSVARNVVGNLNPNSYIQNKELYARFREKKVSLEEITNFTFSDLYPEIWKDLSIRQFEREKRQLEGNKSMATDQFECKRCHKRECTYYELQTRSADEPMTIFIQCVNCGKHWRQ